MLLMILINQKDRKVTFKFNRYRWVRILTIARAISWIPQGTLAPEGWTGDTPWNPMNYTSSCGQLVTEEEAAQLARAFSTIIEFLRITTQEIEYSYTAKDWYPERQKLWSFFYNIGLRDSGNQFLYSEWSQTRLNELASFCRQGAFLIY